MQRYLYPVATSESFKFKSVGRTQGQVATSAASVEATPQPVGILTPMRLDDSGFIAISTTVADQVHDNLRNLIQTNAGERLCRYDMGPDLRSIMSELNNSQDSFDSAAIGKIKAAVARWMPYVSLESFTATYGKVNTINKTAVSMTIVYSVPTLGVTSKALQVVIYAM